MSPVLNRVAKWAIFVLNRVGVWRPRRLTSSQTSLECSPPGDFLEVKVWSRDFFRVFVEAQGMSYRINFNLYRNDLVSKLPGNLTICHQKNSNIGCRNKLNLSLVLNLNNSQNVYKQMSSLFNKTFWLNSPVGPPCFVPLPRDYGILGFQSPSPVLDTPCLSSIRSAFPRNDAVVLDTSYLSLIHCACPKYNKLSFRCACPRYAVPVPLLGTDFDPDTAL